MTEVTPAENTPFDVFERTMRGLEQTLLVEHIATFGPITCNPDEKASDFLARYPKYDQFPICRDEKVIGVLERERCDNATKVGACMRPLDESILISAGEPLATFLPLMLREPYYRLVLRGRKIDGVVTRSDVLKLPVRLLAFARITHIELLLADLIERRGSNNEWLKHLSPNRRDKVFWKRDNLVTDRADPPLVELTELRDKRDIVAKMYEPGKNFVQDLDEVIELRHQLAHATDYAEDLAGLELFLKRLELADTWINRLNQLANGELTLEE